MTTFGLIKIERILVNYLKKEGRRLFTVDNALIPDEGNKAVYTALKKYFHMPKIEIADEIHAGPRAMRSYERHIASEEIEKESNLSPEEAKKLAENHIFSNPDGFLNKVERLWICLDREITYGTRFPQNK